MKLTYMLLLTLVLAVAMACPASAATKIWNVGTGNWNVSGNWNPSGIPASGDEVKIYKANAKCTLPASYSTTVYRLYVYDVTTASLTIASGGTLNISTGQFIKVGFGSSLSTQDGTMIQAGNVNLTGGTDLYLGDGGASSYTAIDGKYYLNSGTLVVDQIRLSDRKGFGHMFQAGGSINAAVVNMAYDPNGQSEYRMTGGSLVTGSLAITKGTFDQAKGAFVDVNSGMTISATGVYEMEIQTTSDYSKILNITGNVTLTSGCRLNIVPVGGYSQVTGQEMKIFSTSGTISGTFTNVPTGWVTELRNSNTELWLRCTAGAPLAAFPGAEGEGKWSTGGRGGDVYHVTNCNDTGAGSFRNGVDGATGARTIVFDTSGTITLGSKIRVDTNNMTIAGQTAPAPGIMFRNWSMILEANNLIVRHIHVRPGDAVKGEDPYYNDYGIAVDGEDVIIDHCSVGWSITQSMDVDGAGFDDVTVQYCIISEPLDQTGLYHGEWNTDYDPGGPLHHGNFLFVKPLEGETGTFNCTAHHNLLADGHSRAPCPGDYNTSQATRLDFRNNVIYDTRNSGYSSGASDYIEMNYVSNYLIAGPVSEYGTEAFESAAANDVRIYQTGNKIDGDKDGSRDGTSMTWSNFTGTYTQAGSAFSFEAVTTAAVDTAYTDVLAHAGAFWWSRDNADARAVSHVTNNNGDAIDSQSEVGGYQSLTVNVRDGSFDTDADGMSNTWETANGTNPSVADNNGDIDGDGWTNLEEYINSLAQ